MILSDRRIFGSSTVKTSFVADGFQDVGMIFLSILRLRE
ncbi:hypothetical protein LEP1GSC008_0599 [Leptospira kirschneri serovar Bulgarica str. Nikolaevo]|uniref:Uncharacterized protein n=1 Tax=Leptospira kirschneri serovar Bulgarica str. Nikolaevo TaxID=1240687 RepID=M6FQA2_9LEPT|nr:hypothetical protein LEP1GSC008_1558 [Leptospira kirschneri serovar Bulgarica str. Nikolaevo]EMK24552.1 hypothetical protein LEP1GSC008_2631 [Leptospira kirschneri serovar Bulgarica str. Nikolaevo]EMK24886.1 hypothetical protein LEP1GSC008_0599 [Leptospira kirschneri serovar Bulgarica str. Nikolaevo]